MTQPREVRELSPALAMRRMRGMRRSRLAGSVLVAAVVAVVLVGAYWQSGRGQGRAGTIAFLRERRTWAGSPSSLLAIKAGRQRPSAAHVDRRRHRLLSMVARWEPDRLPGCRRRAVGRAPQRYGASAFGRPLAVEEPLVCGLVSGWEVGRGSRPRSNSKTNAAREPRFAVAPQDHRHPKHRGSAATSPDRRCRLARMVSARR